MKRSSLLAVLLLIPCAAGAEQYTLRQCADYAAANSPEVQETALGAAGYRANEAEARAARDPGFSLVTYAAPAYKVTGDADHYRNDYRDWGPYYHARLEAQMPLWTWGKIDSYIGAAQHGRKVAESETAQKRGEVLYDIKKYYNGLLLARRLGELLGAQFGTESCGLSDGADQYGVCISVDFFRQPALALLAASQSAPPAA